MKKVIYVIIAIVVIYIIYKAYNNYQQSGNVFSNIAPRFDPNPDVVVINDSTSGDVSRFVATGGKQMDSIN